MAATVFEKYHGGHLLVTDPAELRGAGNENFRRFHRLTARGGIGRDATAAESNVPLMSVYPGILRTCASRGRWEGGDMAKGARMASSFGHLGWHYRRYMINEGGPGRLTGVAFFVDISEP